MKTMIMWDTTNEFGFKQSREVPVLMDYTGKTEYHELRCGCKLTTYKARSSITLRRHLATCKKNQVKSPLNLSHRKETVSK